MIGRMMSNLTEHLKFRQRAVGVVEIILILLVLVGLVVIFQDEIVDLAESIFSDINDEVDGL